MEPLTCVLLGDGFTGKSFMIRAHTFKQFPMYDLIASMNCHYLDFIVDEKSYTINLYEVGDSLDIYNAASNINPQIFAKANVFVVCYSITSVDSYNNVSKKWLTLIKNYRPDDTPPIILVATQIDVREKDELKILDIRNTGMKVLESKVTRKDGKKLARKINATDFLECSAITREGIQDVFNAVLRAALKIGIKEPNRTQNRIEEKLKCSII